MTTINSGNYSSMQMPKQDPDTYAKQYAEKNGLSLEDAKAELKSKFGDPSVGAQIPMQPQGQNIFSQSMPEDEYVDTSSISFDFNDFSTEDTSATKSGHNLFSDFLNTNHSSISLTNGEEAAFEMDPDAYAKQYAEENNMTLEEAKEELKEKYGDPQKKDDKQ